MKHRAYTDKRPFKLWGGMLHSVGCNQPSAHNWADRWNRATAPVIANYVTEPDLAIETLPLNKRPWTSGSGKNGNANDFMFQVEMAEPASLKYGNGGKFTVSQDKLLEAKDYVKRNYETAVKLFADTFKKNGLDPLGKMPNGYPTIMSHAEGAKYGIASNHGDPEHLWRQLNLPFSMDTFRRDVKLAMSATPTPPKDTLYRVQVGTFDNLAYAEKMAKDLEDLGYPAYVITEENEKGEDPDLPGSDDPIPDPKRLKVGDKVKVKANAQTYTGGGLSSWVYDTIFDVLQVSGNRIVIGLKGEVTAAMNEKDLVLQTGTVTPRPPVPTSRKVKVNTKNGLNVRQGPSTSDKVLRTLKNGTIVTITTEKGGWGYIETVKGWISLTYTIKV